MKNKLLLGIELLWLVSAIDNRRDALVFCHEDLAGIRVTVKRGFVGWVPLWRPAVGGHVDSADQGLV